MELEIICDKHEEMTPKGVIGVGKDVKEAFQNAESALQKLCSQEGYDLILYGTENKITRTGNFYHVKRDAKFVKIKRET